LLSDPAGALEIVSTISLAHVKQGSEQAEFLSCTHCEQIVAMCANIDGVIKASINADCLHNANMLGIPTPVSAHLLSPNQKETYWAKLWMPLSLSEPD
jgi:hypothetical protein